MTVLSFHISFFSAHLKKYIKLLLWDLLERKIATPLQRILRPPKGVATPRLRTAGLDELMRYYQSAGNASRFGA